MIKSKPVTASTLRLILFTLLFGVAIITSLTIKYVIDSQLRPFAIDVSHTIVDANSSQDNVQKLQKIQKSLIENQDAISRASSIVADSQSYQYQDQIITDINDYATQAGISITNIDFTSGAASSSSGGGGSSSTSKSVVSPTPAPSGVKSTSISVTMRNPVNYNSFLRFLKSIEQNLTKMQISRIGLSKSSDGTISSDVLTIEVYVR